MEALEPKQLRLLPPSLRDTYFRSNSLFARYGVPGDGSCFFHSLCAARNTNDYLHVDRFAQQTIGRRFRCAFTDHLTDGRWERFIKYRKIEGGVDAATARKHFCNGKHWADETMIRYVSDVLKMNLVFIDTSTEKIYCGVRGKLQEPLVIILWLNHSHFEPLVRLRDFDANDRKIGAQLMFDSKEDSDVVNSVMNNYRAQCSED